MAVYRERLPEALDGERLDRLIAMVVGCTRSEAAGLVASGAVTVDGKVQTTRSTKLAAAQEVVIDRPDPLEGPALAGDSSVAIDVVHVDDDVIVVDKPAGLVVHPGSANSSATLVQGVLSRWPEVAEVGEPERPGIVHRIDKGTSGLLVVARTQRAYDSLVEQFGSRTVEREYRALCWGHFDSLAGMVDAPIGRGRTDPTRMTVSNRGRVARTRYEVIESFDQPAALSLLSCRLDTGRTHQIRVHLAAINHPIVGDRQYGGARSPVAMERPWLHAARLGFVHPGSGEHLSFESALPDELAAVLEQLS